MLGSYTPVSVQHPLFKLTNITVSKLTHMKVDYTHQHELLLDRQTWSTSVTQPPMFLKCPQHPKDGWNTHQAPYGHLYCFIPHDSKICQNFTQLRLFTLWLAFVSYGAYYSFLFAFLYSMTLLWHFSPKTHIGSENSNCYTGRFSALNKLVD